MQTLYKVKVYKTYKTIADKDCKWLSIIVFTTPVIQSPPRKGAPYR